MENTEKKDTSYHLYGMHPVLEAVLSGRQIEKVLLRQGLEGQQFRQLGWPASAEAGIRAWWHTCRR